MKRRPTESFALTRRFAAFGLISVLAAAIALAFLYREISVHLVVDLGESGNVPLVKTIRDILLPELAEYLKTGALRSDPPPRLSALIDKALYDSSVVRLKVYDANGIIAYSTRKREIGIDDSSNARFQKAMHGEIEMVMHYRDAFSLFQPNTADDNLIETYAPIPDPVTLRPIGVIEVYSDTNLLVRAMNWQGIFILAGIALILAILYGLLVFVVYRSDRIIAQQRQTVANYTETLERLSVRMLNAEESERRRIAVKLQEEIVQALSAVKVRIEAYAIRATQSNSPPGTSLREEILPLMQQAIREVRAMAMGLYPPSLDDAGLIATTQWLCYQANDLNARLEISLHHDLCEDAIPKHLKPIIFRILQETLALAVRLENVGQMEIKMKLQNELELVLELDVKSTALATKDGATTMPLAEKQVHAIWERAVLSGASFSAEQDLDGGTRYKAVWEAMGGVT